MDAGQRITMSNEWKTTWYYVEHKTTMNGWWCQTDEGVNVGQQQTDDDVNWMKAAEWNSWKPRLLDLGI